MQLEVDTSGFDRTLIRVRALEERFKEDMIEAVTEGSETAYRIMLNRIPRDSGRLAGSIEQGPVRYTPGGPGGGGFYEADVTVGGAEAPYANIVLEGSGIFHLGHPITASDGNIRTKIRPEWKPTTGAKYMVFTPKGKSHPIRKKSVIGQPAKTFWLLEAQQAAQAVVERKIAQMAIDAYF